MIEFLNGQVRALSLLCAFLLIFSESAFGSSVSDSNYRLYKKTLANLKKGRPLKRSQQWLRSNLNDIQLYHAMDQFKRNAQLLDPIDLLLSIPSNDIILNDLSARFSVMKSRSEGLAPLGERGRYYAWNWGFRGRTAIYMYLVTGDPRFTDLAIDHFEYLLSVRDDKLGLEDDIRGRIVESWGTRFKNGQRGNEVTIAGLVTLPMCQLLSAAKTDSKLKSRYRGRLEHIEGAVLETLRVFLPEMRESVQMGGYFFHEADQIIEPLNHTHVYAAALARCAKFDQSGEFANAVDKLARYFLSALKEEKNGSYSWAYKPEPNNLYLKGSEHNSKASVTIEFPFAAYEEQLAFSHENMRLISQTYLKNIYSKDGSVAKSIGLDKLERASFKHSMKKKRRFLSSSSWMYLSCIEPSLRVAVVDMLAKNKMLLKDGWLGGNPKMSLVMSVAMYHEKTKCKA